MVGGAKGGVVGGRRLLQKTCKIDEWFGLKALDCCGDAVCVQRLIQRSGLVVRTKEMYNTVHLVVLFSGDLTVSRI